MRSMKSSILVAFLVLPILFVMSEAAQRTSTTDAEVRGSSAQGAAWSQGGSRRLYESASECGPDQPEPVWGQGNKLLGYECNNPSANGN